MKQETKLVFEQLNKALMRLEEVISLPTSEHKIEVEAAIHCFEFTIELFWKSLKKYLEDEYGFNVNGPKPVLQKAYQVKLINDENIWLQMLDDRNLTSHTYKEVLALEIYQRIKIYTPFLRDSFDKMMQ